MISTGIILPTHPSRNYPCAASRQRVENKKGAKAFARPCARVAVLLVGLLSSRQFELPTTAGFDLGKRNN